LTRPLTPGRVGHHGEQHLVEAKRNHRRQTGEAQEEEGVAQMRVEDVVHLTNVFRVSFAGFGQAERILKVANNAVTRFLEHHDENGDEDEIELFLRDEFQTEQTDGGVGGLALKDGQRSTVCAKLTLDERERENGVNAKEKQRKTDRPSNGTAREPPNAPGTHDDGEQVNEEDQQGHDHQQRPLKRFQFSIGRQAEVKRKQHACQPRKHQSANEQHDESDDETEFDALLNFGGLEGDKRHGSTQTQTEHKRHKEAAHAVPSLARQPITEGQLVGDQEFDGVEQHGVVDGADNVG